jgi:hypothetical protein
MQDLYEENLEMTLSPYITHLEWGKMEVENLGAGRDFKLYPGGGKEWDWRESNTHHIPGIQPVDVQDLVEHGANVVVVSRGMLTKLEISPEALEYIEETDIEFHIMETKLAVELYNHLAVKNAKVGGLFHSTC